MTVINTNVPAMTAQRNLGLTHSSLSKSIERLSSGLRINRASDDAAGLSISEKLRAQVRGLNQAVRNSLDGVSMIQPAEGALSEVHSIMQRMRELAVQASNGTLSSADRNAIQLELTQLSGAFLKISTNTKFNALSLLTGQLSVSIASGTINSANAFLTVAAVDVSGLKSGQAYTLDVNAGTQLATFAGGGVTQEISYRAMVANDSQVLNFDRVGASIQLRASGTVTLANIATELDPDSIVTSAVGPGVKIQIGSDAGVSNQLDLNFVQLDPTTTLIGAAPSVIDVSAANILLGTLDTAIGTVSNQRATLGALQNALESIIRNLNVSSENLAASESRIRDLDVAAETVSFTKSQILQQAGTAILAQANVMPQSVLSLLR